MLTILFCSRVSVRDDLEPGKHELHCELLKVTADPDGGREFRIISLMRWVHTQGDVACLSPTWSRSWGKLLVSESHPDLGL